jgi:hypothetical protein
MVQSLGHATSVLRQREVGAHGDPLEDATSCLVDHEAIFERAGTSIQPVRAGIVAHPLAYRWSSRAGRPAWLLTPHPALARQRRRGS